MNVIWRKLWGDLWGNKVRTLLVVLSIAAGVFAIGAIFALGRKENETSNDTVMDDIKQNEIKKNELEKDISDIETEIDDVQNSMEEDVKKAKKKIEKIMEDKNENPNKIIDDFTNSW